MVIPSPEKAAFMYMGTVVCTGPLIIYLYKHSLTRRYLNLDTAGRAYRYEGNESRDKDCYYEIPLDQALSAALS